MKLLLSFAVLFAIVAACFGATSIGFFNDPKHPGKCTINGNLILSPGDIVKDPNMDCGRVMCGDKGFAEFQTCPSMGTGPGCKIGGYVDLSKDYPDCCERKIVCE